MRFSYALGAVFVVLVLFSFSEGNVGLSASAGSNFTALKSPYILQTDSLLGEKIYKKNCKACHGKTGDKGFAGASDLTISTLKIEERTEIVNNGKGKMQAYAGALTAQEVEAVVKYLDTLLN